MAKIKKVQLKAVKMFEGREGYGFNANIYFNNRFVGKASDYGNGGCVDINFSSNDIKLNILNLAKQYFEENPKYMLSNNDYDYIEEFIEELLYLHQIEKSYKTGVKQGYPITVTLNYNHRDVRPFSEEYNSKQEEVLNCRDWNDEIEANIRAKYNQPSVVKVYRDISDFDIE